MFSCSCVQTKFKSVVILLEHKSSARKFVSNPEVYFNFGVKWTSYLRDYFEPLQPLLATASLPLQMSGEADQHAPTTPPPEQMLSAIVGFKKHPKPTNLPPAHIHKTTPPNKQRKNQTQKPHHAHTGKEQVWLLCLASKISHQTVLSINSTTKSLRHCLLQSV